MPLGPYKAKSINMLPSMARLYKKVDSWISKKPASFDSKIRKVFWMWGSFDLDRLQNQTFMEIDYLKAGWERANFTSFWTPVGIWVTVELTFRHMGD